MEIPWDNDGDPFPSDPSTFVSLKNNHSLSSSGACSKSRKRQEPSPLSLSKRARSSEDSSEDSHNKRFKFSSKEQLDKMSKGFTPANTSKATQWALNVFSEWKEARNKDFPNQPVPEDLLTTSNPELLNTHLSQLAVEVRKGSGEKYPPATIHQLLCGLLRHMRTLNPLCVNFLDKKDARFKPLQGM